MSAWSTWAAIALTLSLGHVFLDIAINRESVGAGDDAAFPGGLPTDNARFLVLVAADAVLFGAWAGTLAAAAFGDKGALAALLGYVLLWGFGQGGVTIVACLPGASDCAHAGVAHVVHGANLVFGLAAAVAIGGELRARRGTVRWARASLFAAPLALTILLHLALAG